MDIRYLTETYAVSPQIAPEDVATLREAGFTTIICNRPDSEIGEDLAADVIAATSEALGLKFVVNPVSPGMLSFDNVTTQRDAVDDADGPVFAYCKSGNRSSIVWALSQAGRMPTDEMIATAAKFGYNLEPYRDQIEALAAS